LLSLPRVASSTAAYGHRQKAMAAFDDVLRSTAAERDCIFFDYTTALTHAAMSPEAQTASDGLHLSVDAARALGATAPEIEVGAAQRVVIVGKRLEFTWSERSSPITKC
jgi:hypothetical protein